MKKFCIILIFVFGGSLIMVSNLYAQGVFVGIIKFKDKTIKLNPQKVVKWVEKTMSNTGKKKLSKVDVENIVVEFELFENPKFNKHLRFKDGDVSYWYEQHIRYGVDEEELRFEFAARKTVLEAADDQEIIIPSQGDLSHLAQQIMADLLRLKQDLKEGGERSDTHVIKAVPGKTNGQKSQPFDVASRFSASGWMGDGESGTKYVQLIKACKINPYSTPYCIKITYTPGPKKWAGIYWQNKPNNWGDFRGEDFSRAGYKKLTFWARGENGGEVVEFKAGGINAPGKNHRDSFEVSSGKVVLERTWEQYTLNLESEDLSCVIGGFCWVASRAANPDGLTFYLDDIYYDF
ncbi:MAG: hypothetical protein KAT34_06910 [Candidatus Aminicenantes bacterium]|nr:hypothetical protein [Candidatus Aminicenantes bacterium]